MGTMRR